MNKNINRNKVLIIIKSKYNINEHNNKKMIIILNNIIINKHIIILTYVSSDCFSS